MLIIDAHLDLAYNALRGRDLLLPAAEQTPDEDGIPTVGLPDLRAGQVGLVCATIFCEPSIGGKPGYRDSDQASAAALRQLEWYQQQEAAGHFKFVTGSEGLAGLAEPQVSTAPTVIPSQRAVLLLEGADPIRNPGEVDDWFEAGLCIVGLAWKGTRHAGGTGAPGPLTSEGKELVRKLDEVGIVHDLSHLAEESFWQLLQISSGPVMASHSNCRSIVPTDRQLSDDMIRAIVERDGVIGINFYDKFLLPPAEYGTRRAKLADVVRHVRHVCELAGSALHVGIGTDMDGGLGREQVPEEIRSAADLPRVSDALLSAGFSDTDTRRILGGNWLRFFQKVL